MIGKISHKLVLAIGGLTITFLAVFSYFIIQTQHNALLRRIENSANQLSETVKSSTKYDMLLNRREDIHRIIDTIGKQQGIEKVRVFNKDGAIIYSSDESEIGNMLDKQAESCYACHAADQPLQRLAISDRSRTFMAEDGHRNFGIISPIYNEPGCWQAACHAHDRKQTVLGVLDVTLSLSEIDAQLSAESTKMVYFAIALMLAVSFMLWFMVHRLVGRPVDKLVWATNELAAGNLDCKITVNSKDELGKLGHAFNEMTEKLAVAQRQILQSDKLASIGRLAAGVAHEINNPLTGVLTYSSFLQKRVQENSDMKNDLDVIVRETKRCREIVKGLLDFSRQAPQKIGPVNVNKVIRTTLGLLENQFKRRNILLEKECADDLPEIRGDGNQIEQVLLNLLVNAQDAIGKTGGEIRIVTSVIHDQDNEFVQMVVRDSGCGMPSDQVAKIFEPFFTTKGQSGTGLGLSVVWGIVENHGGAIAVESEPGKGSTFTIRLPVSRTGDVQKANLVSP